MNVKHLRVLELGDDAALAFCCMQLARWGAQVAVGEAYVGDLPRRSPTVNGVSLTWRYLTTNKTLVSQDLADLAADADAILTNRTLDELAEDGIEPGSRTIFHRVVPFASDGMYNGMGCTYKSINIYNQLGHYKVIQARDLITDRR